MTALLVGGSVLAAFFAGAVALFSPCCIVFLLPAYLTTAVKNRRWRLLPLTLVFALGLAVVLLPITLGVGLVASSLGRWHTPLYVAGGLLMLALAALAFTGRTWSMPSFLHAPDVQRADTAAVFSLGIFSGVASSCCAPVLAGVMTLSALSSSPIGAAGLGLAYVFGMVSPLFVLAVAWDRLRLGERRAFRARPVTVRAAGRTVHTSTVNLAVAGGFAVMGGFVLYLAATGNTTATPGASLAIGRWLSSAFGHLLGALAPVPQPVLGLALVALAVLIVVAALRGRPFQPREGADHVHEVEPDAPGASGGESRPERPPSAGAGPRCH